MQPLPPTIVRTVAFTPCPVCGRSDYRHPAHRRNHIARCEAAALAADYATGVFDCDEAGLAGLLPAPMIAAAHIRETTEEYRQRTGYYTRRHTAWVEEV